MQCAALLTTVNMGRNLLTRKGVKDDSHNHAQNPEDVEALRIIGARILDNGLVGVDFWGLDNIVFGFLVMDFSKRNSSIGLYVAQSDEICYYGFGTAALTFQYYIFL